jgi:hypothetical protein
MSARRRPRAARAKRNPALVVFGNPARVLGDVKAIVYRHAKTRELMVHGFGPDGERIRLEDLDDGIAIHRLPRGRTDARALANADGSVTIRNTRGERLWADL